MFFCSGCVSNSSKSISEITDLKSSGITKIVFYDGRGGLNKPLTITSKKKIDEFLGYLDKTFVEKENKHKLSTGWIHHAEFYNNDRKMLEITFGNTMIINRTEYYSVIKNNLSTEKIDEYLKSINSDWKTSK